MRYLVISDVHGDANYIKKVLDIYKESKFDKILCLGDILYHGPRNDLPSGYNPKECIKLLNEVAEDIISVKGNCDAYVDQMVLNFHIFDEYEFDLNGHRIIMTHGHIINPNKHLNITSGVVLYGHTHIHKVDKINNVLYLNPGSLSIPKAGQANSYAILDDEKFVVYDFSKNILLNVKL